MEVKYNARTHQQFESWGSQVKKIAFWEVGGSNLGRIQVKQQHMERGEVTTLLKKEKKEQHCGGNKHSSQGYYGRNAFVQYFK